MSINLNGQQILLQFRLTERFLLYKMQNFRWFAFYAKHHDILLPFDDLDFSLLKQKVQIVTLEIVHLPYNQNEWVLLLCLLRYSAHVPIRRSAE